MTALFSWQVPFLSFPGAFRPPGAGKAGKGFIIDTVSVIAPKPAVPLHTLVAEGDPAESLITASEDADLRVVGTRGRSRSPGSCSAP